MHVTLSALSIGPHEAIEPHELCRGCVAADPNFFGQFATDKAALAAQLAALAQDAGSDCHGPVVATANGRALGFLFAYPLREMFSRQAQSLRRLLTLAPVPAALRQPLADLARSKGRIGTANSYYLARIYVGQQSRGQGVGEALMREFEAQGRARGFGALSLHVRRENDRAQRFYTWLGFTFTDRDATGYLSMEKEL